MTASQVRASDVEVLRDRLLESVSGMPPVEIPDGSMVRIVMPPFVAQWLASDLLLEVTRPQAEAYLRACRRDYEVRKVHGSWRATCRMCGWSKPATSEPGWRQAMGLLQVHVLQGCYPLMAPEPCL